MGPDADATFWPNTGRVAAAITRHHLCRTVPHMTQVLHDSRHARHGSSHLDVEAVAVYVEAHVVLDQEVVGGVHHVAAVEGAAGGGKGPRTLLVTCAT
jgi:hypothetical protein